MMLGKVTPNVSTRWIDFSSGSMPGSVYWWCRPTGVESSRNRMKTSRGRASEKSFPPAIFGTIVYQEM